MRRFVIGMGLVLALRPLAAQETLAARNWSMLVATGWMASTGGGSETMMRERIPALYALRFRIDESPWWLGVEVDAWIARATQAGRDSIVVRSHSTWGAHDGRASFNATTLSFLARRDLWRSEHTEAFAVGGVGATMSSGRVVGKCGSNFAGFPVCTDPPLEVRGAGLALAGSIGAGVNYSYVHVLQPIPAAIRWVLGERVLLEARVRSQAATEGRFTGAVLHLGIGW